MKPSPTFIQFIYLLLLLFSTLATSLIWGIDTLFQLSAGLRNTQVFTVIAFFTIGQVIFEVPTGMIADIKGRRFSYLLGTVVLAISTLFYVGAGIGKAPLPVWILGSTLLGLGYTFFSGATEAWLVDALEYAGYEGRLEAVFSKGQVVRGVAMLVGSVSGGFIAQFTELSVPYVVRSGLLLITFVVAFIWMKDWGYQPSQSTNLLKDARKLFSDSALFGWHNRAVGWLMISSPFMMGVSFYAFYAMQPYLLELFQNDKAYGIAGLAAAIVAGAQIIGGLAVPYVKSVFKSRTTVLILSTVISGVLLFLIGLAPNFWVVILLLSAWGLISALAQPVRQAYLNAMIPAKQRATVLSFDSLMGSSGGIFIQPTLGRIADVSGYATSFMVGAAIQTAAVPFMFLAKRKKVEVDVI